MLTTAAQPKNRTNQAETGKIGSNGLRVIALERVTERPALAERVKEASWLRRSGGSLAAGLMAALISAYPSTIQGQSLPAPANVWLDNVTTNQYWPWRRDLHIHWSAVEGAGLYGIVWIDQNGIKNIQYTQQPYSSDPMQTSGVFWNVGPGVTQFSVTAATDVNDMRGGLSPAITYNNPDVIPWSAPTNLQAVVLSDTNQPNTVDLKVSWPSVPGIASYRIDVFSQQSNYVYDNDYVNAPGTNITFYGLPNNAYRIRVLSSPYSLVANIWSNPTAELYAIWALVPPSELRAFMHW